MVNRRFEGFEVPRRHRTRKVSRRSRRRVAMIRRDIYRERRQRAIQEMTRRMAIAARQLGREWRKQFEAIKATMIRVNPGIMDLHFRINYPEDIINSWGEVEDVFV